MVSDGAAGDPVVFEAEFVLNLFFFIQVPNDGNLILFGANMSLLSGNQDSTPKELQQISISH